MCCVPPSNEFISRCHTVNIAHAHEIQLKQNVDNNIAWFPRLLPTAPASRSVSYVVGEVTLSYRICLILLLKIVSYKKKQCLEYLLPHSHLKRGGGYRIKRENIVHAERKNGHTSLTFL